MYGRRGSEGWRRRGMEEEVVRGGGGKVEETE